ncbi:NAD(P)-dependent oxidoreductase [Rhodoferax sp.]|uniref:NAD-dependent epimerase/dehydratase family protein n=1 Tax=Rhodoferax sp. TaxID=50421 RepID=UPI0025CF6AF6|nr:NAD(P)-dependent oxidoreductase [Rhodoferax sp.]
MKFTVLGGGGFVGTHLVRYLRDQGHTVDVPARSLDGIFDTDLGHVIYAIGLTGDFRKRPFDTVEAHVCLLAKMLQKCRFESWLYLSSTRVYASLDRDKPAHENSAIVVAPGSDSLYNLSKLMGESLCLAYPDRAVRVARLSNVYGAGISADAFLGSVMSDLRLHSRVTVNESPDSGKDYVAINEVTPLLEAISLHGLERLYNVASGRIVTHRELFEKICEVTGFSVDYSDGGLTRTFPVVDISRAQSEFGFQPNNLLDTLDGFLIACGLRDNAGDDL